MEKTRPLIHNADGGILEPIGLETMKCAACGSTFEVSLALRRDKAGNDREAAQ